MLGLASSGAHSNGYSLVRKIIERSRPDMNAKFDGERTLADVVMAPTRIYVKPVLATMEKVNVKGMAHITGGGLVENVPRMLPDGLQARLVRAAWPRPPIFDWLQEHGNVAEAWYRMGSPLNLGRQQVATLRRIADGLRVDTLIATAEGRLDIDLDLPSWALASIVELGPRG